MVKRTRKLIIYSLLIGAFSFKAWAKVPAEPRLIDLDLRFFNPFRPAPPPLFFQVDEAYVPVKFPRTIRGEALRYKGPETMIFYTRHRTKIGEIEYRPVAKTLISQDLKSPLLVFHMSQQNNGDLDVGINVMEVDPNHFPRGFICMVNLTNITMHGMIEEQHMVVNPGVSRPYRFADNTAFRLGLAFEFDGEAYPSFLNTVTLDPATRQWMFIGKPRRPGSSRVQVRFVEDHAMLTNTTEE